MKMLVWENVFENCYARQQLKKPQAEQTVPSESSGCLVSLGDLYAGTRSVCGDRGEYGIASQHGPDGCVEALRNNRVFCKTHIPDND